MDRRKFLGFAGVALVTAGGAAYLISDNHNITRADIPSSPSDGIAFKADEREILYLASLAPSGHNTQPWLINYIQPYHWIICNDKTKWLPAVDPTQRETMLSIGTFLQNLESAAGHFSYACQFDILAKNNQDENVVEIRLKKTGSPTGYDIEKISSRRTLRSGFESGVIKTEDVAYLTYPDINHLYYFPSPSKEATWLNEQTIEANKLQIGHDGAQKELADWIRFSSKDAKKYRDGLTTASMEINGLSGLFVRNFYGKDDVMKKSFRDKSIDKVREQVAHSAGWMVISSTGNSVALLIETGMRMQRLFLKVRSKGIALHPMTQILEETETGKAVNTSTGISDPIQFLLRVGYVADYPAPVSLRRPVDWFVKV